MAPESPVDLRLSGPWSGDEPGWTDGRVRACLRAFLVLGVALRLLRFGLSHPLWGDEAFLAANLIDRDYAALMKPLDYQQVCPLLFLWGEKAITLLLGFSEATLRLIPTIASIAGLFLFRHVAGRLLKGVALLIAVAILAVGYTPIRHGGEIKPYASDFLIALGLIALAVEWLRAPDRNGFLWALAAFGPFAIGFSNPSIFVAASVGLVLTPLVLKTRSMSSIAPLAAFGLGTVATFLVLLRLVTSAQSASVMGWMSVYWADAFPPRSPLPFLSWFAKAHTSHMFAYPAGGERGASTLTTGLVVAAIFAYVRRGSKPVLALLLTPFLLGLIAAAMGRYPYGGSARTMQYVAPAIMLMAGLGASVLIARLPRMGCRRIASSAVIGVLFAVGLTLMAWDVKAPYKLPFDRDSRDFARRFWAEESRDAELVCAHTDLDLPHDPFGWQGDRSAVYLCQQAIYSDRHRAKASPDYGRVSETHPLRVVVFGEAQGDLPGIEGWIEKNRDLYELRSRRERVVNRGVIRGRASFEDRYVIYELTPRLVAAKSAGAKR